MAEYVAECDKANTLLGWKAKHTLDEICRDSFNFISKNPKGIQ